MSKSIKDICNIIEEFSTARGWANDDPNQLITAIFIELGELAEHFMWRNKFEPLTEDAKLEVGYEFVDVIMYLFRLANKADIDIEKYFDAKLPKLAKKYPVNDNREWIDIHSQFRKEGKNKRYE